MTLNLKQGGDGHVDGRHISVEIDAPEAAALLDLGGGGSRERLRVLAQHR
jgi:hypothetical protein